VGGGLGGAGGGGAMGGGGGGGGGGNREAGAVYSWFLIVSREIANRALAVTVGNGRHRYWYYST
jgi:hypothetical protein